MGCLLCRRVGRIHAEKLLAGNMMSGCLCHSSVLFSQLVQFFSGTFEAISPTCAHISGHWYHFH